MAAQIMHERLNAIMKRQLFIMVFCLTVCAVCVAKGAKKTKTQKTEQPKIELQKSEKKASQRTVQVVNQECVNLSKTESVWLPGLVQDKIKSNLQEYLDMRTVVDSKSETALKKLQAESESAARDETTAIELGKISTAKFGLFVKLRKTGSGYTVSADYTDLTTGEQLASVISKEYTKAEYLYGSTGAVDEMTIALAGKLGIELSDLNKNLLTGGSAAFTVDEQLALAKQNEEQYQKLMAQYDDELAKLSVSNDLSAVENKRKIEAEKALLVEKQNSELKRQEELRTQKEREAADEKLEAERSIALKTQRDKLAKEAAAKASEVRKLKMSKQGVFGQINIIESKKKALLEIRGSVEVRCQELYKQLCEDRADVEAQIRSKPYSTVELGTDGQPTNAAKERREKQVAKAYQDFTNKFFVDCDAVKASAQAQDSTLLAEIRADQRSLATTRTVSSMGDELKVSFGAYESEQNGWRAYLSLYSEGILLYKDDFIVNYDAISGKKAPNIKTELNDAVIAEYSNNVDIYNSLLTRGYPIVYFEIDYIVNAEEDDKPSAYKFNFNRIRVINTVGGNITQTNVLSKKQPWTMLPKQDLRFFAGVQEKEKAMFNPEKYIVEVIMTQGFDRQKSEISAAKYAKYVQLKRIPGENFEIMITEVTQVLYQWIMGSNPSQFNGESNPVENTSWYDAICFCNKLSLLSGFEPVYSVKGTTDINKWGYRPHNGNSIDSDVTMNKKANGFRLPTTVEWEDAAKCGKDYKFSGSDNINTVSWNYENSGQKTHPVAQKNPNIYGIYDMTGNVSEWVWCNYLKDGQYSRGGSYRDGTNGCELSRMEKFKRNACNNYLGFRVARNVK